MDFKIVKDAQGINQALFQITHGLYILTAKSGDKVNGQCVDAVMQVTNMPPRVAIGVGKRSLTHEMIKASGRFLVNVIDRECEHCYGHVKHFGFQSGRKIDKFATIPYQCSEHGLPILPDAKSYYECKVVDGMCVDLETHTLFVGLIETSGIRDSGEPLTYNEYRKTMKR